MSEAVFRSCKIYVRFWHGLQKPSPCYVNTQIPLFYQKTLAPTVQFFYTAAGTVCRAKFQNWTQIV